MIIKRASDVPDSSFSVRTTALCDVMTCNLVFNFGVFYVNYKTREMLNMTH